MIASDEAVPAPTAPSANASGPRVLVAYTFPSVITNGPNLGLFDSIAFDAPTALGDFGVGDVGDCGLNLTRLAAGVSTYGAPLLTCGAGLGAADPSRSLSEVPIDGVDAYGAGALVSVRATRQLAGFPVLTMSRTLSPAGLSTFSEHDTFVTCGPGAVTPPTDLSCTALTGGGVRLVRSIVQSNGGRRLAVADRWESTGAGHVLDLLYEDAFSPTAPSFPPFWNGRAMATRRAGDFSSGPRGPGTLLVDASPADPADIFNPQAAITWAEPPARVTWYAPNRITEAYHRVIPKGGSVTITRVFDTAPGRSELQADASASLDPLSSPVLTAKAPARTTAAYVVVTGRATDLVGVTRLTVAGRAVTLEAGGTFRVLVAVRPGRNTIRVVARDGAGNATTRMLRTTRRRRGGS